MVPRRILYISLVDYLLHLVFLVNKIWVCSFLACFMPGVFFLWVGVDLLVFLPKPLSLMISSSVMGFVLTFVALLLACGGLYSFWFRINFSFSLGVFWDRDFLLGWRVFSILVRGWRVTILRRKFATSLLVMIPSITLVVFISPSLGAVIESCSIYLRIVSCSSPLLSARVIIIIPVMEFLPEII